MKTIVDLVYYGDLPIYDVEKCSFIFGIYENEELKWNRTEALCRMTLPIMYNVPFEKLRLLNSMKYELVIISIMTSSYLNKPPISNDRLIDLAIGFIEGEPNYGEIMQEDNLFDHLDKKLKEMNL